MASPVKWHLRLMLTADFLKIIYKQVTLRAPFLQFSWFLFCLYPIDSIFQAVFCCHFCLAVSHLSLMVMIIVWIWCWGDRGRDLPSHGTSRGAEVPTAQFAWSHGLESWLERTKSDDRCGIFLLTYTRLSVCVCLFAFFCVFMGTFTVCWGLCSCHLHTRYHIQLGSRG